MLIDAKSVPSGTVLRSRFCIVGSGMGGSTVAQNLVAAGHDVLLLEAGGVNADPRKADAITGECVGRPFRMPRTRCIELGGTSNLWHGLCSPLDPIDFESRSWIEGSGWPFTRTEMDPFYEDASRLMNVSGIPQRDVSKVGAAVRERLQDIPFNSAILENKIFEFRKPPPRWKSTLLELARRENFRCVVNATALELMVSENFRTIDSLIAGVGEGTIRVFADVFVVCAGTLETPRLLLNSRQRLPAGVGNSHDLVGKYLLDHPNGHFGKIGFHRPTKAPIYAGALVEPGAGVQLLAGVQFTAAEQQKNQLANTHVFIRPSVSRARIDDDLLLSYMSARSARNLTLRQIRGILTHRDILLRILMTRFGLRPKYRYGDIFFMTEQLPNPDSCVRLSGCERDRYGYPVAQIDWRLSEADLTTFENFAKLLFEHGLQSQTYSVARTDEPSVWDHTLASAAHHVGTARMTDDASRGVVSPDLQVFGLDNLFLCDGSVFPTAGSVNPALTITALALRLAAYLDRHQRVIAIGAGVNGRSQT